MGSLVLSNVSTCGILNFAGRGKCRTPTMNGDSVCCTRASIETGARPFTASFIWLSSCSMPLNLCSHDRSLFLLIKDGYGSITYVVPSMPILIAILSGRFVRITLPSLASFSFSICSSRRVEVLLLFLGEVVWAFSGLSCLLGALHLPGELFQLSQQMLVCEAEHLHLICIGLYSLWCTYGRSTIYVALLVLHPWRIGVAPACVPSGYQQSLRDQFYL